MTGILVVAAYWLTTQAAGLDLDFGSTRWWSAFTASILLGVAADHLVDIAKRRRS